METPSEPGRRVVFPRWTAPIVWPIAFLLLYVFVPSRLSTLSTRRGWSDGRPGVWNLLSLVLVVAGTASVAWSVALHLAQIPRGWGMETTNRYLLENGPYSVSRNPTYLSILAIWIGWTFFYGSAAVFAATCALWAVFARVVVPYEERQLEARFGEEYARYRGLVPRWLGRPGRR